MTSGWLAWSGRVVRGGICFGVVATGGMRAQGTGPQSSGVQETGAGARSIAITVDDLPGMDAEDMSAAQVTEINRKIVAAMVAVKAPGIGFVNEEKLYKTGEVDARIAALEGWMKAGLELGNHTYSHTSLDEVDLRTWEDDVVQGESVTRMLMEAHKKTLRYLRFPYLDDGPDIDTKRAAGAFLTARHYRVAPVTIDPRDWYFADIYDDAHRRGDRETMGRIAAAWLTYADEVLAYSEGRSRALIGYEPKQIVLLHATWLEADHMPELLALLSRRGYRFITVGEALTDAAYAQPDDYVSDEGATQIEHWAVTRGMPEIPGKAPVVPEWVKAKHLAFDAADAK